MNRIVCLGGLLLALLLLTPHRADAHEDKAHEERIARELRTISPEAEPLFSQANAALERGDLTGATALYERVRRLAPTFVHATRRQCHTESALAHTDQALRLCREALAQDPSPASRAALAAVLGAAAAPKNDEPTPNGAQQQEALALAKEAISAETSDFHVAQTACHVGLMFKEFSLMRSGLRVLSQVGPEELNTHLCRFYLEASERRWDAAEASLSKARERGLPRPAYQDLSQQLERARSPYLTLLRVPLRVGAAWIGAMLLLFGGGALLSHITLRAAGRGAVDARVTRQERTLRRGYALVLWLCSALFYVSIPLVALLVLAVAAAIILLFLAIGILPIKLLAIVVVVVLATLVAMLKGVFTRIKDDAPGTLLDLQEHPRLAALLQEVAARVGTRPVDRVYMQVGVELAVTERGGLFRQLRGHGERVLIIGAGLLEGLRLRPLRAMLAHEYGHFSNRDTAGGHLALAVRNALQRMVIHLALSGAAAFYNPAWLFVNAYLRVFLRISQGASRLQEVLADRFAVCAYGSAPFEEGLRHVIDRGVRFEVTTQAVLKEVVEGKKALRNLYEHRPASPLDGAELQRQVDEAVSSEPSVYDSHPSPLQRFASAHALATPGAEPAADDQDAAWSLFADRPGLERGLTAEVRDRLWSHHGVRLPEEDAPAEEAGTASGEVPPSP